MNNKERFVEIFTSQIHRPGAAELLEWLESTDFFEAPASTHYHGSFKLVCTGGPYGDCCCSYAVELRGEWTVQEFVKAVLERNPCEWGFFYIQRAGQKWYEAQVKIEYQYGNLKSTVPEKIARKKIKRVHSNGGWSLMDYWIET